VDAVIKTILLTVLTVIMCATSGYSHPGGFDSYGCHHDNKRGGYHCHKGEFIGQSFKSQQDRKQSIPFAKPTTINRLRSGNRSPHAGASRESGYQDILEVLSGAWAK